MKKSPKRVLALVRRSTTLSGDMQQPQRMQS
jgi:hypothetical protein